MRERYQRRSAEWRAREALETERAENRSLGPYLADGLIRRTGFPLRGVKTFDAMQDLEHTLRNVKQLNLASSTPGEIILCIPHRDQL